MNNQKQQAFPDPLASTEEKMSKSYGLNYAKSLMAQWGGIDTEGSLYRKR